MFAPFEIQAVSKRGVADELEARRRRAGREAKSEAAATALRISAHLNGKVLLNSLGVRRVVVGVQIDADNASEVVSCVVQRDRC